MTAEALTGKQQHNVALAPAAPHRAMNAAYARIGAEWPARASMDDIWQ
jgi:hypothetical protein